MHTYITHIYIYTHTHIYVLYIHVYISISAYMYIYRAHPIYIAIHRRRGVCSWSTEDSTEVGPLSPRPARR